MTLRPDDATQRQILAADPAASTWVAANAGSGKTRVLTDRVARLLLGGVPPEKVLCLTYTKAAAAEMQNRLFQRLGEWAMLPDAELRAELATLGAEPPSGRDALRAARRLFARAIEAPGGLKIQTIHAFSAALLRRFPLEARVAPDFAELDDRAQRLMLEEIVEEMADGSEAPLVEALAREATGEDFAGLTAEIAASRARFGADAPDLAAWLSRFGLPAGYDGAAFLAEVFLGGEAALVAALLPILRTGGKSDQGVADRLAALDLAAPSLATAEALEGILLTKSGQNPFTAKLGSLPTKALREGAAAPLMPALEALMLRVEAARPHRLALAAARRSHALNAFAVPFLARYAAAKQAQGALDFDDLILNAGRLLSDRAVAQWVLFRLDGGIDHILVDEAQDTSPAQWEVIRRIAEEFSTGESARSDTPRTLFVVGDVKQSIYSFQGADPANFGRMRDHFDNRLAEVKSRLITTELQHSFRSAPAILRVVDLAFARPERHVGLGGLPEHIAFNGGMAGRVDLWPEVEVAEKSEEGDWTDPVDRTDPAHHDIVLARAIAAEIRRLIDAGETLPLPPKEGVRRRRPLGPGDFLILVQRRSTLFAELIRACKAEGLPIAGADRLRLGAELAVKDLAALLSFLATPEDDLSLAAALKSPLFGWSEDRLYRLAQGRKGYLWEALRAADAPDTVPVLDDLRREADFLRPFEILERALTRHDGRRKLLARLGPEAEDGIDALLAQALAYERSEIPSLTGFLTWMETEDIEVKRQLAGEKGVVRVMTVHGAKGLEAPVVILPDTRPPAGRERGEILTGADGAALWATRADAAPPEIAEELAARKQRAAEERMRLLYVAMTRAESWLIVAGAGDMERGGTDAWHRIVAEAMEAAGAVPHKMPTGAGFRLASGDWEAGEIDAPEAGGAGPGPALPAWAGTRAPAPAEPDAPLSPSDLGGAKALPAEAGDFDEAAATRRGRLIHRLLEHLPAAAPASRPELARRLLATGEDIAEAAEADALLARVAPILADPSCEWVFAPGALAEAEFAARLPALGGRLVAGAIDRLLIAPDLVRVVDYKTNALVPDRPEDVPEGILRQMGAYAAALAEIYPGREVETAILWTEAPRLMLLPPVLTAAALARVSLP